MTIETHSFAPGAVNAFIREATPAQRAWFLTRGEPQCLSGNFMDRQFNTSTKLFPGLRGVAVGSEVATAEEAVAKATEVRDSMLAQEMEPVDEAALGIDGEAVAIAQRFQDSGARIERIIHIGSMICDIPNHDLEEVVEDAFQSLVEHLRHKPPEHAPLLEGVETKPAVRPMPDIGLDLPILLKLAENHPDLDGDELLEELASAAHDEGAMGFLVEVSVPEYRPHSDGRGASIHGGIRYTAWRYGSTYQVAADRALEWGARRIAEMWPQRKAA